MSFFKRCGVLAAESGPEATCILRVSAEANASKEQDNDTFEGKLHHLIIWVILYQHIMWEAKQSRLHRPLMTSIKTSIIHIKLFSCWDQHMSVINGNYFHLLKFPYLTKWHCVHIGEYGQGRVWIVKTEGRGKAVFSLKWHHGWIYL